MKKLMRSRNNKIIAGVCGGFAEYFNIDPTIIRIVWFILALMSFGAIGLAYIICIIVIPEDNGVIYQDNDYNYNPKVNENTPLFIGGGLILIGSYLIAKIFFPWIHISVRKLFRFWPVLLILLGIYILFNHQKEK